MRAIDFTGFEWDTDKWPKCSKHGVSRVEIEAVFLNGPSIYAHPGHSVREQRLRAVGTNDAGRFVYVSFTLRQRGDERLIRPVSARYMHQREIDRYGR